MPNSPTHPGPVLNSEGQCGQPRLPSWSLVTLWPGVFPPVVPFTPSRIDLGMRSAEALKSGRKPLVKVGRGLLDSRWAQSFGPMDLSTHKQGCLMWQARAEPSKLCVPGQGPSCLGLRVILMCPGVYSNLLIMQNAQNVLFELALEAGTDVPPPKMCNHACVILLFRVD